MYSQNQVSIYVNNKKKRVCGPETRQHIVHTFLERGQTANLPNSRSAIIHEMCIFICAW